MNSSVTSRPQPLYQISPRPRIGALSVETLSYILLGLGGLLPVVFLLGVAIFIRCYRRHKEAELNRWKAHIRQDRRSVTGSAKSSQATRTKAPSDVENLSFSLHDSDLGLEPYFGGINGAADLNDTLDYTHELKRSVTNSNVYFKDETQNKSRADVDSAIADSEPSSSVTDHQSSVSSSAEYHIHDSIGHKRSEADSGSHDLLPNGDASVRRMHGHSPGVIMGVNHLMDSTGRANDRSNRNNSSGITTTAVGTQPTGKGRAPPAPPLSQLEFIHQTFNQSNATGAGGRVEKSESGEDLGNDEEQVLRYFDDIHSNLSFEEDNSSSFLSGAQDKKASLSFRRHSNFNTTRL